MKLKLKNLENYSLKMEKGSSFDEPFILWKKILLSFVMFILYPTYLTRTLDYNLNEIKVEKFWKFSPEKEKGPPFDGPFILWKKILLSFVMLILYPTYLIWTLDYN